MGQPARQAAGCGSPAATCWRRVRDWQQAGVWDRLHQVLLAELRRTGQLDLSRCSLDSVSVRAKRAGELTGANPVDRGKRGSKYRLLVERGGVPLAGAVSAANTPDAQLLEQVVDAVPPVKGRVAGRVVGRSSCTRIRPTTAPPAGGRYGGGGSSRGSPDAGSSPASGLGAGGGWWSGRWRGCLAAAGCKCATNVARTSCRPGPRHCAGMSGSRAGDAGECQDSWRSPAVSLN
jgi:hypothetical protein